MPIPQSDPATQFGFLVADVARLLRENFNGTAKKLGLTLAQARVLMHLARNEGTSQVALARLLEVQPITLLRQIDRLAEMALIERRANPADRRAQQIYLTPKARPLLDRIWHLGEALREQALEGLQSPAREQLLAALTQVKDNLARVADAQQESMDPQSVAATGSGEQGSV